MPVSGRTVVGVTSVMAGTFGSGGAIAVPASPPPQYLAYSGGSSSGDCTYRIYDPSGSFGRTTRVTRYVGWPPSSAGGTSSHWTWVSSGLRNVTV